MKDITNKLIHYDLRSSFERDKARIPYTSIVFIDEDRTIYTHGTEYNTAIIEKYIKDLDKDLSDALKKSHQDLLDLINELSKYVEDMYKKDVDDWSKQYEEAIAQMDEIRRKLAELTSNQGSAQIDIDDINARIQLMTQYWNKLNGTYTNLQAQIDAMKGVADINGEWFNTIENMINTFKSEVNLQLGTFRTELENLDLDARIKRLVGREMNAPDGIIYDYVKQIVGTNTDPDAIEQAVEVWFNALDPSWAELTSKVSANETALAGMRSEIDGNEAKWTAFTSWKRGVDSDIAAFKASSGDDESFAEMFAQHFNEATGEDFMASIFAYANNEGSEIEAIADFINMIAGKVQLTAPTMEFTTELLNFIAEQINATGNLDVAKSLSVGTGNNKISIDGTNGIKHAGNGFLLKLDGSGLVANGNISWDANGNVTLRNTHIDIPTASGGNNAITFFITCDYRSTDGYSNSWEYLTYCTAMYTICKNGYFYIDPTPKSLKDSLDVQTATTSANSGEDVIYTISGKTVYKMVRGAQIAAVNSGYFNKNSDEPVVISMSGQSHIGHNFIPLRFGTSIVYNTTVKHLMNRYCGVVDMKYVGGTNSGPLYDIDENGNVSDGTSVTIQYSNPLIANSSRYIELGSANSCIYPHRGSNSIIREPLSAGYVSGDVVCTINIPYLFRENGVTSNAVIPAEAFDNSVYAYRTIDPRCINFWKLGSDGIWEHMKQTDYVLGSVYFDYAGLQTSGDTYTLENTVMDRLNTLLNSNFPNASVGDKVVVTRPVLTMEQISVDTSFYYRCWSLAIKTAKNGWIFAISPMAEIYNGHNTSMYDYTVDVRYDSVTYLETNVTYIESLDDMIYKFAGSFSNDGGEISSDFLYL